MFGIGGWELLLVAVVALVVLGPKGLPSAARALGRAASELRRATNDLRQSIELDPDLKEIPQALDELNKPLLSSSPRHRRRPSQPKDGPPEDLPPPPRPIRRDIELDDEPPEGASFISDVDAGATAADGLPPYAAAAVGGERSSAGAASADASPASGDAAEASRPEEPSADAGARRDGAES